MLIYATRQAITLIYEYLVYRRKRQCMHLQIPILFTKEKDVSSNTKVSKFNQNNNVSYQIKFNEKINSGLFIYEC